jgi:hypothetical protein
MAIRKFLALQRRSWQLVIERPAPYSAERSAEQPQTDFINP